MLKKKQHGSFAEKKTVDKAAELDIKGTLETALKKLEEFQSKESLECINKLLEYELPDRVAIAATEIQGLLKLYEDDKAEDKLRALLDTL